MDIREVEYAIEQAVIAIKTFKSQPSTIKDIQLTESYKRQNNIGKLVSILLEEAEFIVRAQGRNCPTCNGTGRI